MEKISICDLEWYDGDHSIPNLKCMQLSSYYKQCGAEVTLITKKEDFSYNYDILYLVRENENTPVPAIIPLNKDKDKIKLVGNGFKYYAQHYNLPSILASIRPDYLLYEGITGKYANANFVQYFCGNTLITKRQDYHNTLDNKKFTVVMDKNFWSQKTEDIKWCLTDLEKEKNIAFYYPIGLQVLIENKELRELFFNLYFVVGTEFKWRNNYSSTNVRPIIDFLEELRTHTKSNLGYVPIMAEVGEDEDSNIFRTLMVVDLFKEHKLRCVVLTNQSTHSAVLRLIEKWTMSSLYKLSFVEFVLHNIVQSQGIEWFEILNNTLYWGGKNTVLLADLLLREELRENGLLFRQWGDKKLSDRDINYDYINSKLSILYRRNYE